MSQSYTNLLYHLIFSTKVRQPLIKPDYEVRLYDYIGGIICGTGGISLGVGGIEDHVHILAKLLPERALSDVLRDLKANATGWMRDVFPAVRNFSWQRGLLSANQTLMRYTTTSRGKRNITNASHFVMSSFNS